MNKEAMKQALETIEKSWREDRVRSDLLPAIQTMRKVLEQPAAGWVGLTDSEIEEFDYDARDLVMDIEKLLRERNT